MSSNLEIRRRRASYRAHHRGTKEMDWLMSRYADAHLDSMTDPQLALFEEFLSLPDPDLQGWIMGDKAISEPKFATLVGDMRSFHGLSPEDR